jgi:hypothetical protein
MPLLIDPFVSLDLIDREEMNRCLVAWDHKMGPLNRPEYTAPIDYALWQNGKPIAIVAADTLIRDTCGFTRADAFEMSRMCAAPGHRGLSSLMMRLWRAFAYPEIVRVWGSPWVISYQDAVRHSGNLYRYDGWLKLAYTTSGTDPRALPGTASVRHKVVWGWSADAAAMSSRRALEIKKPKWAERIAA